MMKKRIVYNEQVKTLMLTVELPVTFKCRSGKEE